MARVTISSNNLFPGPKGQKGDTGSQGVGITNVIDNNDGTLTIQYGDGSSLITENLTGPKGDTGDTGPQGPKGDTGDIGP
ncbi:MAG: hypothetical protein ACO3E4_05605, partial [Candidatus Nanopelagicaceae bacterium]